MKTRKINSEQNPSRREFLKQTGNLSAAVVGMPMALNLLAMRNAAASETSTGYKALVCVFLAGGNDHANTLINVDVDGYNRYYAARYTSNFFYTKAQLTATKLTPAVQNALPAGVIYAMNPGLKNMVTLFNQGKLAVQLNVGVLTRPYDSATEAGAPARLYSHNDQTAYWQTSGFEGASSTGWAGRMMDNALTNLSNSPGPFNCIAIDNSAIFLYGNNVTSPYMQPATAFNTLAPLTSGSEFYNPNVSSMIEELWKQNRNHYLEQTFNQNAVNARDASKAITAAEDQKLDEILEEKNKIGWSTILGQRLKMVAKIIKEATTGSALNANNRQVFLVNLEGFDLHSGMNAHQGLLEQLDAALYAFYQETVAQGISDKVTTFTMSEFGRTLTTNGDGTDHGWGGHHFVIGGAVDGKKFYGTDPSKDIKDMSWHTGQGRMIPTTSVDQYAATLGRWFGVSEEQLKEIFPNLVNFSSCNLGFLR